MIKVGSGEIVNIRVGDSEVVSVKYGNEIVWEAVTVETGSGTIEYSFDEISRTLAIRQTATSGSDTYSYSTESKDLDVTTTYDYTIPPG